MAESTPNKARLTCPISATMTLGDTSASDRHLSGLQVVDIESTPNESCCDSDLKK